MVKTTQSAKEKLKLLKRVARSIRQNLKDDERFEIEVVESEEELSLKVKVKKK